MFSRIISIILSVLMLCGTLLVAPSVNAVETNRSSVAVVSTSNIDSIVAVLSAEIGELKAVTKKPSGDKSSYITIIDYTKKDKRMYVPVEGDQLMKLYAATPMLQEKLVNSNSESRLSIGINCNISYPPLKVRCTITISL